MRTSRLFSALTAALVGLTLVDSGGAQTSGSGSAARVGAIRLAVLEAEARRASTARDLATVRAGIRSRDTQTVRLAVRASGRLERPQLIADIIPALKNPLPEIRAEAANAIGQAAQGWTHEGSLKTAARKGLDIASMALIARLNVESEPDVRAIIGETLGRLPYTSADQVAKIEQVLVELMKRSSLPADRLGAAVGLEEMVRLSGSLRPPTDEAIAALRTLAVIAESPSGSRAPFAGRDSAPVPAGFVDPARDARVRRLAMEALIAAQSADDGVIRRAAVDSDAQVRRLVLAAVSNARVGSPEVAADVLASGLADASPMVRVEALRASRARGFASPNPANEGACVVAMNRTRDPDPHVALTALDELAHCSSSAESVALLERVVSAPSAAGSLRGWHQRAHALVALASASAEQAAEALPRFIEWPVWQVRMYAARAAAVLRDRPALDRFARDDEDNVREAAIEGLRMVAGHDADPLYLASLDRPGYQVIRAAAAALEGTQAAEAVPALKAVLRRLVVEARETSRDARLAVAAALQTLGVRADSAVAARVVSTAPALSMASLNRLAAARARVSVQGVGSFELALIATEAPSSVLRFTELARSGYYNGLTFHRVVPNFVIQGGSPGANEYIGDARFMRDEVGQWPHVRGAVGISTRGRDTGDAQIFVDLVDNPRLNHEYTVFAQVLNGMNVVDAILEGDVIDQIEIIDR